MAQLLSEQQKRWLVPIGVGLFVGMLGSIIVGKLVLKGSPQDDAKFLAILVVCLLLSSIITAVAVRVMRRQRDRRIEQEQLRLEQMVRGDYDSKGMSTSSISVKRKRSVTTTIVGLHDIRYEPLPYRPPRVHLTGEEAFLDPYANDKLVNVMQDVYTKLSLQDIVSRVRKEVAQNASGDSDQLFRLSVFRSEGPVTTAGRCGTGWTFYFVREDESHGCIATATRHELSMQYASTKDVELEYTLDDTPSTAPFEVERLPDIVDILELVHSEVPESQDVPLYVRGLPPNNVLVYTADVSAIADIMIDGDTLRLTNRAQFAERLKEHQARSNDQEQWTIDDVLSRYRQGESENDALREVMERTGADVAFASGDKLLFRRIGRGLHVAHGDQLTPLLDTAIETALRNEAFDEAKLLVRCLAFVPTAAAMARLHSFSQKIDENIRSFVVDMFQARRRRLHGTETDLIDRLDFKELQRAKGFNRVVPIGINYRKQNFREDILDRLARDLNLHVYRVRVVTHRTTYKKTIRYDGKEEEYSALRHGMITGAWLRTENGDCEVQINVIPSPVLVQYWYLSGPAAWSVARDLRRMRDLECTREKLLENLADIGVGRRSELMRTVLTLQIWDPESRPQDAVQHLVAAYQSDVSKHAWQLRQFIVDTLIYIRDTLPADTSADDTQKDETTLAEASEQREQIDAFFEELRANEGEVTNHHDAEILMRINAALGDASVSQTGIVQPAISLIRDDLLSEFDVTSETESTDGKDVEGAADKESAETSDTSAVET